MTASLRLHHALRPSACKSYSLSPFAPAVAVLLLFTSSLLLCRLALTCLPTSASSCRIGLRAQAALANETVKCCVWELTGMRCWYRVISGWLWAVFVVELKGTCFGCHVLPVNSAACAAGCRYCTHGGRLSCWICVELCVGAVRGG